MDIKTDNAMPTTQMDDSIKNVQEIAVTSPGDTHEAPTPSSVVE
ncbi:MAG: hypothetical protein OXI05_01160 [Bacteroidota bacterium]|nr:hypothetical protein [Bacteroidota bacterium]